LDGLAGAHEAIATLLCKGDQFTAQGRAPVHREFGERIRQLRRQQQISSQQQLGQLAGLHRTFIGRVERGETNITLANISRLATALRVSLAELFSIFTEVS